MELVSKERIPVEGATAERKEAQGMFKAWGQPVYNSDNWELQQLEVLI